MTRLMWALLVLAHLLLTVATNDTNVTISKSFEKFINFLGTPDGKQLFTDCIKLLKVFSWCAVEREWKNDMQRSMSAIMNSSSFAEELVNCTDQSTDEEDNATCANMKVIRIFLQCSKMTLFNTVDVKKKFAAIMFHVGVDHCVKVNMGVMEEELGMLPDEQMPPPDEDHGGTTDIAEDGEKSPSEETVPDDHENSGQRLRRRRNPDDVYAMPARRPDYARPTRIRSRGPYPGSNRYHKRMSDGSYGYNEDDDDDDRRYRRDDARPEETMPRGSYRERRRGPEFPPYDNDDDRWPAAGELSQRRRRRRHDDDFETNRRDREFQDDDDDDDDVNRLDMGSRDGGINRHGGGGALAKRPDYESVRRRRRARRN